MTFPDRRSPLERARAMLRRVMAVAVPVSLLAVLVGVWITDPRFDANMVTPSPDSGFEGRVSRVIDGDSLAVSVGPVQAEVRLAGIDAPEYRQTCRTASDAAWPCGSAAREALAARAPVGSVVRCEGLGADRYARTLGHCAAGGNDLGEAMVGAGMAVARRGAGDDPDGRYARAEDAARVAKAGLWQGAFTTPADWRAGQRLPTEGQTMGWSDRIVAWWGG